MAKARVLTRSELAEHLGVDKQMVTKWERSGMPVHTRGRGVASQFRLRERSEPASCPIRGVFRVFRQDRFARAVSVRKYMESIDLSFLEIKDLENLASRSARLGQAS